MENYTDLQALLVEYPAVFGYLYNVWLEKYAEGFVSVWTDKHINFGNSTTNRVKSQHTKLKKHLDSGKCDLDRFIYVIENVVQSQDIAIKESLERCKIIRKPKFNKSLFQQLQGFVSEHALDKILEEFNRSKGVVLTPQNCAHKLVVYVSSGLPISLNSIDAFWRKLDLSPSIRVEYNDLNCDHDMQRFKGCFNNQPDHGKSIFLRKLRGIIDPSKNLIGVNLRLRKITVDAPKAKHAHQQTQVPHRHSCLDLNQEPPRHNSFFMDLNNEPPRHSSYHFDLNEEPLVGHTSSGTMDVECSYQFDLNEEPPVEHGSLWKEIPEIFHPYITRIQDVMGDGNCGFQSIAVCPGHGEDWLALCSSTIIERDIEFI